MEVIVLGCGPAGLMAAHAATQAGANVRIVSKRVKSEISGAQYLHVPIKGVAQAEPETRLEYRKEGTARGYARKVYGDPRTPTSWEHFNGFQPAWSLRDAYDKLRKLYWHLVDDHTVDRKDIEFMAAEVDLVLCTVPAQVLCGSRHHLFEYTSVWIGDVPVVEERNVIVYSGDPLTPWYRASNIFGHQQVEFSSHGFRDAAYAPGDDGKNYQLRKGIKPIRTTCNCHQHAPNFVRLGRFGQWRKGVLTSDAYKDAAMLLSNRTVPEQS